MPICWRPKPLTTILNEAQETGEHCLKRALGRGNLIALAAAAIIGTGIFVITGQRRHNMRGRRSFCRSSSPQSAAVCWSLYVRSSLQ